MLRTSVKPQTSRVLQIAKHGFSPAAPIPNRRNRLSFPPRGRGRRRCARAWATKSLSFFSLNDMSGNFTVSLPPFSVTVITMPYETREPRRNRQPCSPQAHSASDIDAYPTPSSSQSVGRLAPPTMSNLTCRICSPSEHID